MIMSTVFLVSIATLKEKSIINTNVDDSLLSNAILESQDIELQQVLGTKLYNKLIYLVAHGLINTMGYEEYKTLLDNYCIKVVLSAATLRALPYIHFKVMNKGVQNQNSDNSLPTSLQELEFLMDKIRNDFEFYAQRLADYLLQHRMEYPEYISTTQLDELSPQYRQYRSNLVLEDDECPCIRSYGYNYRTITL